MQTPTAARLLLALLVLALAACGGGGEDDCIPPAQVNAAGECARPGDAPDRDPR